MHNARQGLAYYILNEIGEVVMRSSVVPLNKNELSEPSVLERTNKITDNVDKIIGNYNKSSNDLPIQKPMDDKDIYHMIFYDVDDHSEDLIVQELDPGDLPVVMPYHDMKSRT